MASQLPVDAMAPIAADTVDSAAFAPAAARSRPVAAVESVAMKASVALRHTGLTSGHVAGELGCCGQRRGPSYSGHRLCTNSAARGASHAPSFAVCANEASGAIDASSAACIEAAAEEWVGRGGSSGGAGHVELSARVGRLALMVCDARTRIAPGAFSALALPASTPAV